MRTRRAGASAVGGFDFGAPAMLSRLSLGIVGLGRLWKKLASDGRAFGMQVCYFDPNVEAPSPEYLRVDNLKDLLAQSESQKT